MRARLLLLILVAACGGHKPTPTPANTKPGGIEGPGIGDNLTKCNGLAKDAVCKCLSDDEVSVCDYVDGGGDAAHVLRVGNEQQTDTYLVVDDGQTVTPIAELLYEQHHGKRDSDLSDPTLEVKSIDGTRVVRLEYKMTASTDYASESYDEDLSGTAVKVCVLDGPKAGCPVDTFTDCSVKRSDYADPPNPANNAEGATTGQVDLADDGTVTVTPGSSTGDPADCAVTAQTVHLVP